MCPITKGMYNLGQASSLHNLPHILLWGRNRHHASGFSAPQEAGTISVALSSPKMFLVEGTLGCFHPQASPMSFHTSLL